MAAVRGRPCGRGIGAGWRRKSGDGSGAGRTGVGFWTAGDQTERTVRLRTFAQCGSRTRDRHRQGPVGPAWGATRGSATAVRIVVGALPAASHLFFVGVCVRRCGLTGAGVAGW